MPKFGFDATISRRYLTSPALSMVKFYPASAPNGEILPCQSSFCQKEGVRATINLVARLKSAYGQRWQGEMRLMGGSARPKFSHFLPWVGGLGHLSVDGRIEIRISCALKIPCMYINMDPSEIQSYLHEKIGKINDEDINQAVEDLIDKIQKYNTLDHEFIEVLKELAKHEETDVHKSNNYQHVLNNLSHGSKVIYFKSADLFRIYNNEEINEKLEKHIRTHYRGKNDIYEVVDNYQPQKVVMVINSRNREELNKIKQHIVGYMRTMNESFSENDLTLFNNRNTETFEILIDKVVKDIEERDQFVGKLLRYIDNKEKDSTLSEKMSKRVASHIPGTSSYLIPMLKDVIGKKIGLNDGYASTYNIVVNVDVGTFNNVTNHITLKANNIHMGDGDIKNIINNTEDPTDDFIAYLDKYSPEWYVPGKKVLYDTVYDEYCAVIGKCSKKMFTRAFDGLLFKKDSRQQSGGKRRTWIKIL